MSLGFIIKSVYGGKIALDCKRTKGLGSEGNLSAITQSVKTTVNSVLLLVGYVVCGKSALSQTKGHGIYFLQSLHKDKIEGKTE